MPASRDYSDDIFADSRMTFGEHIEELRKYLWRAIKGLLFFLVIGFVLDAVGSVLDVRWIGVGRPMMDIITEPVREQVRAFYDDRYEKLRQKKIEGEHGDIAAPAVVKRQAVEVELTPDAIAAIRGVPVPPGTLPVKVRALVDPLDLYSAQKGVQEVIRPPDLTVLSVQEGMVVYFKVSLLCSLVLASPWVFLQIWLFVAAGLYPHEKHYVHKYLPISLGLFLGGIALCQWAVIPRSIAALLWFNDWLGFNPDLRLSEWLGFAIMLPLVFGVAFQTPLVMLFLERIGIMSIERYWASWRMAAFVLAVVAAVITPTPDAFTMLAMWIPLVGLYFLGIGFCHWGKPRETTADESDRDELIEV